MKVGIGSVLVVTAHHDDLELGCGGTVFELTRVGVPVRHLVVAAPTYAREGRLRTQGSLLEAASRAADRLGHETDFMNLVPESPGVQDVLQYPPDPPPANNEMVHRIEEYVAGMKPDLVITQSPRSIQTGHRNVGQAVTSATRRHEAVWYIEPFAPDRAPFDPAVWYTFDESALLAKLESLTLYSDSDAVRPEMVTGARARAEYRGAEVGASYAECFEVVRWVL